MNHPTTTGLAAGLMGIALSACASPWDACCSRSCRPCCDPCAAYAAAPTAPNPYLGAALAHGRGSGAVWSYLAAAYDADRDGKITEKEYPRGEKTFARLDRDGDKVLTAKDFAGPTRMDTYIAALVLTRLAASAAPAPAGDAPAADDEDLPDDAALARVFARADADHDGRVREDELDRALAAAQATPVKGALDLPAGVRPFPSFTAAMDEDKSGDLTLAEETAWAARMRKEEAEAAEKAAAAKGPPPPGIPEGPKVGEEAPDFTLKSRDGATTTTLSSFKGKKAVALVFGSYTCPPFRKAAPAIRRSYDLFGRDVQFFFVYIREAHSVDGRSPMPAEDQPLVEDPRTPEERTAVANACALAFHFDAFETLVDGIDDKTARAYVAPPVRLYVVGKDGTIAYRSGRGPFGMDPAAFEAAVGKAAAAK